LFEQELCQKIIFGISSILSLERLVFVEKFLLSLYNLI